MKVICLSEDPTCEGGITIGKTYDIHTIGNIIPTIKSNQYCIIDNFGKFRWYDRNHLELLDEFREKKINDILR